ncbi:MAG: AAA family ATPase, partial [Verrucomicrobia bacterium]|nr:AAA family ATPase [Verrucomicrobiota bacterium]
MVSRHIRKEIESHLFEQRAIIIYGARQVGKTTLVRAILRDFKEKSVYLNCDEPDIREELTGATSTRLSYLFGDAKL